ncbi:hypothetical protein [Sphingobium aquiterrae]|uniref:hypothetical protein n=1 Tax=Sphingobium aquiterrae TaxID=2038656 RepID=UPI00301AF412
MTNSYTGQTKAVPTGFSWTTFFFGCFPAIFRGDMFWGFIMFLAGVFTWGLSNIVFAFFYNQLYMNKLIEQGYRDSRETQKPSALDGPPPPQQIIQQVFVNTGQGFQAHGTAMPQDGPPAYAETIVTPARPAPAAPTTAIIPAPMPPQRRQQGGGFGRRGL